MKFTSQCSSNVNKVAILPLEMRVNDNVNCTSSAITLKPLPVQQIIFILLTNTLNHGELLQMLTLNMASAIAGF